jgi:serine protease AprX
VSIKVLGADGSGYVSDVIKGIDWCIEHKDEYGIRILNLSLGSFVKESYKTDPLCHAVEQAWTNGIVVVAAAGNYGRLNLNAAPNDSADEDENEDAKGSEVKTVDEDEDGDSQGESPKKERNRNRNNPDEGKDPESEMMDYTGYGTITSPGNDPYIITVGAMNSLGTKDISDDNITTYSSRGPTLIDHILKPDLVAPGNKVISLSVLDSYLDRKYPDNRVSLSGGSPEVASPVYTILSGTSMAAAVVSGACALMLEKEPWLTPDTIKARLMKSSRKLSQNAFVTGAGYLDIAAALEIGGEARVAISPSCILTKDHRAIVTDISGLWGDDRVWNLSFIWADALIWAENFIWAENIIWSENFIWVEELPGLETIMASGD